MSLSLITDWQQDVFLDALYLIDQIPDSNGETATYSLAGGPYACNLFNTDNYDEVTSDAGNVKVDNFLTANWLHAEYTTPAESQQIAKIVARTGVTYYYTINGRPKQRAILGFMRIPMVPSGFSSTNPPPGVS